MVYACRAFEYSHVSQEACKDLGSVQRRYGIIICIVLNQD